MKQEIKALSVDQVRSIVEVVKDLCNSIRDLKSETSKKLLLIQWTYLIQGLEGMLFVAYKSKNKKTKDLVIAELDKFLTSLNKDDEYNTEKTENISEKEEEFFKTFSEEVKSLLNKDEDIPEA